MLTGDGPAAGDTLCEGSEGSIAHQVFGHGPIDKGPGLPHWRRQARSSRRALWRTSSTALASPSKSGAPACSRAYPGSGSCSRRQANWRPSLTTFPSSW